MNTLNGSAKRVSLISAQVAAKRCASTSSSSQSFHSASITSPQRLVRCKPPPCNSPPSTCYFHSTSTRPHLGLRSNRPPDSLSGEPGSSSHTTANSNAFDEFGGSPSQKPEKEVTDQEWELRTGRAIFVLQETLPTFFDVGVVTNVDKATGAPKPHSHAHFHIPIIDTPNPLEFLSPSASHSSKNGHASHGSEKGKHPASNPSEEDEPIYSSDVRLEYTPPVTLPSPFPRTFKIEGLQLYLATSAMIRHAMNAMYSDLQLSLVKVSVVTTPPSPPPNGSSVDFSSLNSSVTWSQSGVLPVGTYVESSGQETKINRDKHLLVRQLVVGSTRVGGKPHEWEVESMYTFSPLTGLIWKHTVNSIHPAPHIAVYHSMRSSLGKVFGFSHPESPTPTATVNRLKDVPCTGRCH